MGLLGLWAGCLGRLQIYVSMKYLIGCKEEGGVLQQDKLLSEGAQTLNSLPLEEGDSTCEEIQDCTGHGPEKPASVVSALTRWNWTRSSEFVRERTIND